MPAPLRYIDSSPTLPADAVIIGGGIIGTFTAYYLAKRGLKVALVKKGLIGAEQSSRNWDGADRRTGMRASCPWRPNHSPYGKSSPRTSASRPVSAAAGFCTLAMTRHH
jgi:choline dehydrogenase-like flavoprotein